MVLVRFIKDELSMPPVLAPAKNVLGRLRDAPSRGTAGIRPREETHFQLLVSRTRQGAKHEQIKCLNRSKSGSGRIIL